MAVTPAGSRPQIAARLEAAGIDSLYHNDIRVTDTVALEHVKDAAGSLRAQIEALPDLKMICIPATGYDRFDIEACRERGIVVSNVRGYAVNTVPEHAFALILALRRGIVGFRQAVMGPLGGEG